MEVLFLDRQVMAVTKPAGMLSQKDRSGDPSVIECARRELSLRLAGDAPGSSPRNPFVAAVHRLDRPVSGVLLLARTSKSAARLGAQFREAEVHKGYLAVLGGRPVPDVRLLTIWLKKERPINRVSCRDRPFAGARRAEMTLQLLGGAGGHWLVALFPRTGLPHQLRAAMGAVGCPIEGDLKYGSPTGLGRAISLHAHLIRFNHPVSRRMITVLSPIPREWPERYPWLLPQLPAALVPTADGVGR